MSDDWPVTVGRKAFKPIPDSWVALGHDAHADADGTRIYAVSVAAVPDTRDVLAIRYVHPRSGQTLTVRTPGAPNPSGEGLVPASLVSEHDWPRSRLADADPDGSARDAEMDHLRELWHEHADEIPAPDADDRELIADGGRDVLSTSDTEHSFEVGDVFRRRDSLTLKVTNRMVDVDTDELLYRLREPHGGHLAETKILTESQLERDGGYELVRSRCAGTDPVSESNGDDSSE